MHINSTQLSTLNQMYALEEAAKSEAHREDDRTRRKLLIAAAASLPGEGEDCVVRLSSEDGGEPQGEEGEGKHPEEEASAEDGGEQISDYA